MSYELSIVDLSVCACLCELAEPTSTDIERHSESTHATCDGPAGRRSEKSSTPDASRPVVVRVE